MRLILLLREWRAAILVGIVCLGVGVFIDRFTAPVSRPREVSVDTERYLAAAMERRYEQVKRESDLLMKRVEGLRKALTPESAANTLPYYKPNPTLKEVLGDVHISARNAHCRELFGQMLWKKGQLQVSPPAICIFIPADASYEELVDVAIKYGEEHPEDLRQPFPAFARDALADAWPCWRPGPL